MPSLFIGLGPNLDVPEDELRSRVESVCPIQGIRMQGQCAFVDVASVEDGERVMAKLDRTHINSSRLSVQWSKRRGNSGPPGGGGPVNNNGEPPLRRRPRDTDYDGGMDVPPRRMYAQERAGYPPPPPASHPPTPHWEDGHHHAPPSRYPPPHASHETYQDEAYAELSRPPIRRRSPPRPYHDSHAAPDRMERDLPQRPPYPYPSHHDTHPSVRPPLRGPYRGGHDDPYPEAYPDDPTMSHGYYGRDEDVGSGRALPPPSRFPLPPRRSSPPHAQPRRSPPRGVGAPFDGYGNHDRGADRLYPASGGGPPPPMPSYREDDRREGSGGGRYGGALPRY